MGDYVIDHNTTRRHETIRHNKLLNEVVGGRVEGKACRMWSKGSGECWNFGSAWKCVKVYEGAGIELLSMGLIISAHICQQKWSECYGM